MTEKLTQKASLITDGLTNYAIKSGVWTDVGAIPTIYSDKVAFFEEHGFRLLTKIQLQQLKTVLTNGTGRYLTLVKAVPVDFFNDGSAISYIPFDGETFDEHTQLETIETDITYVPSNDNLAASFNGTTSKIQYKVNPMAGLFNWSFSCHVKTTVKRSYLCIASNFTGSQGFWIQTDSAGRALTSRQGGNDYLTGTKMVCDGILHSIIVTKEGGHVRMYVDGALDLDMYTTNWSMPADPLYIGALAGAGDTRPWVGAIERVRIFNRALTQEEVILLSQE